MPHLHIGDIVPKFSTLDNQGTVWTQDSFKSNWTLIHFQTQIGDDMLKQIQYMDRLFRATKGELQVVGVVVSNGHNQKTFMKEHGFSFPVLLDEHLQLVRAFGTWEPFKGYHKSYMNVIPSLFLLDQKGYVIWQQTHICAYELPRLMEAILRDFYISYDRDALKEPQELLVSDEETEEDLYTLFEDEIEATEEIQSHV
ncbi:peroxiredoxin family protein [Candidatus Similichlamydia laticola]|uniref:Alkyl hydroperoxide reductase subunit C/ Thiol specific antioxidant domain-containing protein n=1 Tax=Candidatus Similichlamydia laticola TaxID=2170265 RepID=A0A369K9B0_9BACT|nr:redoxin domain-containing protein [Candidatus Similichlamydia laticola]RDB31179.1 hypothetical protein HAT2_00719 [Candidatus Similichlamydia laticola]